jgi:hypothetical protein
MKRIGWVLAALVAAALWGCSINPHPTPVPTPEATPTPVPTPEATPTPVPTPDVTPVRVTRRGGETFWTVPYFPGTGSRWEKASQIPNFYRQFFPLENGIIRFGGWDCQPEADTSEDDQIACLLTYAATIEAERPDTQWIFSPDYVPGRGGSTSMRALGLVEGAVYEPRDSEEMDPALSRPPRLIQFPRATVRGLSALEGGWIVEDPFFVRQLRAWTSVPGRWGRTRWLEVGDEWGTPRDPTAQSVSWIRQTIRSMGLPQIPLSMTQYAGQVVQGGICDLFDVCAIELYAPPPGERPRAAIFNDLHVEADRELGVLGSQDIIGIPACYTRNGAFTNLPNASAVCLWGYQWCAEHRDRCVAAIPFSGARLTGIWDQYEVYWQMALRGVQIASGTDPGSPEPPPEVQKPGKATTLRMEDIYPRWYTGPRTAGLTINAGDGFVNPTTGQVIGSHRATFTVTACDAKGTCFGPNEGNWAWRDPDSSWTLSIVGPAGQSGMVKVTFPASVCTVEKDGWVPFNIENQVCESGGQSLSLVANLDSLGTKMGVVFMLGNLSTVLAVHEVTEGVKIPEKEIVCDASGHYGPGLSSGAKCPFNKAEKWPCGCQCGNCRNGCPK